MKHSMISRREAEKQRLLGYVEDRLLPMLGLRGVDFELDVPAEGTRSVVLYLNTGQGRFVLKCYRSPVRASHTALATRHLVSRGAPIPRLVASDLSPLTFMRIGNVVLVEERIDGVSFNGLERTDARLAESARALARLHSIRRDSWGTLLPGLGRRGGFFEFLQGRLDRRMGDLTQNSPLLGEAVADPTIREWFQAQRERVSGSGGFSLCHLRVSDSNILFGTDGKAWLIDVLTARYAHPAIDLERALFRWCRHKKPLKERFLASYFQQVEGFTREEWQRGRPYFQASFYLTQAYRAAKELRRFRRLDRDRYRKKIRRRRRTIVRHLGRMLKLFARVDDGPPEAVLERGTALVLEAAIQKRKRNRKPAAGDQAPPDASPADQAQT